MYKQATSLLFLLLMLSGAASAEIYKWVDAAGNTHFSDKPVSGAKEQRFDSINSIHNPEFNLERSKMEMRYTDMNGSMLVQGKVNGVAMQFIVDTGASLVTIPPAIARQARLNTRGARKIILQTANGKVRAPLVNLSNIEADGVSRQNIRATVQALTPDGRTGLLGMSFLSNFRMTIDHNRKLILLNKK